VGFKGAYRAYRGLGIASRALSETLQGPLVVYIKIIKD
jgi:hypothetical protein